MAYHRAQTEEYNPKWQPESRRPKHIKTEESADGGSFFARLSRLADEVCGVEAFSFNPENIHAPANTSEDEHGDEDDGYDLFDLDKDEDESEAEEPPRPKPVETARKAPEPKKPEPAPPAKPAEEPPAPKPAPKPEPAPEAKPPVRNTTEGDSKSMRKRRDFYGGYGDDERFDDDEEFADDRPAADVMPKPEPRRRDEFGFDDFPKKGSEEPRKAPEPAPKPPAEEPKKPEPVKAEPTPEMLSKKIEALNKNSILKGLRDWSSLAHTLRDTPYVAKMYRLGKVYYTKKAYRGITNEEPEKAGAEVGYRFVKDESVSKSVVSTPDKEAATEEDYELYLAVEELRADDWVTGIVGLPKAVSGSGKHTDDKS